MPDTTVTTTTAAPHIPEQWGNQIVGAIAGTLRLAQAANRNWGEMPGNVGDIVNVPVIGAVTVADKAAGTDMDAQAPADSTIQVALNKHKYVSLAVEDIVSAEANTDVMNPYLQAAALAIAEQIEKDGFAAAYAGFTTNSIGSAATALTEDTVILARQKLVEAFVPQSTPKYLFVSTKDVAAFLKIARLTEADKLGIQNSVIREGAISMVHGFVVVESQYIPASGNPLNTHNVALAPDALTLAMRPLKVPRSPGVQAATASGVAGTEAYGVGIRTVLGYDMRAGADRANIEALYGWKVVRETFGVHVLS